jgi:putative ABC transport system substrate-binding protein
MNFTPPHLKHCRGSRQAVKNRIAAVLLVTGAVLTNMGWTGDAWGQEKIARVGILSFTAANDEPWLASVLQVLRRTLAGQGWVEGKNISYEYRSAHSDPSRFAEAAEALVALKVDVIVAGSAPALRAAFAATHTIPIVAGDFTTDAIAEGYVDNYARPGGNVTGVFLDAPEIAGKWFELLRAMVPNLSRVAVVWDPGPGTVHLQAVRGVAASLDITLKVFEVRKPKDIDAAFAALRGRSQAVIFLPSPLIYGQSARLARLSMEHRLPATSMARDFAIAGGVLAYGPELISSWESMAVFVSKILGGSDPAGLPVQRSANIQLVVNVKTAKALGLMIPQSILLRADEVIR